MTAGWGDDQLRRGPLVPGCRLRRQPSGCFPRRLDLRILSASSLFDPLEAWLIFRDVPRPDTFRRPRKAARSNRAEGTAQAAGSHARSRQASTASGVDHVSRAPWHRIGDRRIIRLIQKWLKAGVLEDGIVTTGDMGTGQGSVISPLLANIYICTTSLTSGRSAGDGVRPPAT